MKKNISSQTVSGSGSSLHKVILNILAKYHPGGFGLILKQDNARLEIYNLAANDSVPGDYNARRVKLFYEPFYFCLVLWLKRSVNKRCWNLERAATYFEFYEYCVTLTSNVEFSTSELPQYDNLLDYEEAKTISDSLAKSLIRTGWLDRAKMLKAY